MKHIFVFVFLVSTAFHANCAEFVAEVEGKQFHAQHSLGKNWDAAYEHCQSLGMTLASISSAAQVKALLDAHSNGFSGTFWTAGRHPEVKLSQFLWNNTEETITGENEFLINYPTGYPPQTCLTFTSGAPIAEGKGTMMIFECSMPFGILCETLPTATTTTMKPITETTTKLDDSNVSTKLGCTLTNLVYLGILSVLYYLKFEI